MTIRTTRRTIVTRDKDTILRLTYKTLVRPQLEYCIQVYWSPYLKQDMEKLEKVQGRATNNSGL